MIAALLLGPTSCVFLFFFLRLCPSIRLSNDTIQPKSACCPSDGTWDRVGTVYHSQYTTQCCPVNFVNVYYDGTKNWPSVTSDKACCPTADQRATHGTESGGSQRQRCCPPNNVLTDNGNLYCCDAVPAQGTRWAYDDAQGKYVCCPGSRFKECGSSTARCCPNTNDVCTSKNYPCCPQSQVIYRDLQGTSSTPHCCPPPKSGQPPLGPEWVWVRDDFCCPATWLSTNQRTCCPGPLPSQYRTTSNNDCCPSNRVIANPQNSNDLYCCPSGQTASGSTWTTNDKCCPSANVETDLANGNLVCCPGDDTQYRAAQGNPCCPVNRIKNGVCCPNSGDADTPENDCCPSSRQITYNGELHCCVSRNAQGSTWLPTINDCCETRLVLPNPLYCCPSKFIPSGASVNDQYENGVCDPNSINNCQYCCPKVNIETSPSGKKFCCPAASDKYISDSKPCCPSTNIASPFCPNLATSCSCTPGTPSCSACCPSYAEQLPPGSTFYTSVGSSSCCPNSKISKNPATGGYSSNPTCCPDPDSYRVDQAAGGVSQRQACCPFDWVLKQGTNYYCCPSDNAYRIPGGPTNNNPPFVWASNWCCPAGNVKVYQGTNYCCPSGDYTVALAGHAPSMVPVANGADKSCCPTPQVIQTTQYGPYCCPPTYPPGTTATSPRNGWTVAKDPSSLTKPRPRSNDLETCCPPENVLTSNVTYSDKNEAVKVCCPIPASQATYISASFPCCPTATITYDANGVPNCCPDPNMVYTPDEKCCPGERANDDRSRCCPAGIQSPQRTAENSCCPLANTFTDSQGNKHCCPNAGEIWDTTSSPERCCVGYRNNIGIACCPNPGMINTTTSYCCPPERVDSFTGACCPDDRWNDQIQQCCPPMTLFVEGQCCPIQNVDTFGKECCVEAGEVLDANGNCCPEVVLSPDGLCCPPEERDWTGRCCRSDMFMANVSWDPDTDTLIYNNTCCVEIDCEGVCVLPNGTSRSVVDVNGVCCPRRLLDCAGMCPLPNGTSINVQDEGGCCPPGPPHRDCHGVCGGRDLYCCEAYSNCTSCIAQPGCGWCVPPLSPDGQCRSGTVFGPNGETCEYKWLWDQESTVLAKFGSFGPDGQPPHIQPKHTIVLLVPDVPVTTTIQVRAPVNLPLDIFLMQDLSSSFSDDLPNMQNSVQALVDNVILLNNNTWFGWGSFIDKPISPFGYWSLYSGTRDYECKLHLPISSDPSQLVNSIQGLSSAGLFGGQDVPESQLDCILSFTQDPTVGWRSVAQYGQTNRLLIIISDAPYHQAGDVFAAIASGGYPDLGEASTWTANNGDAVQDFYAPGRPPVGQDPDRCCLAEDYASADQAMDALIANRITPIFLIAQTGDPSYPDPNYNVSAGYNAWADFQARLAAKLGVPAVGSLVTLDTQSLRLVEAVTDALKTVTQTISLVETTVPPSPFLVGVTPLQQSAPPGTIVDFEVTLLWDTSNPNLTYPFVEQNSQFRTNLSFDAIFPLTNVAFENATIEVVMAPRPICGYCGDGITEPAIGEQCDFAETDPANYDPRCCTSECTFSPGVICDDADACYPKFCTDTGYCVTEAVNCSDVAPEDFFCAFNRCIGGECVWQCTSDECCNDNDNCTTDVCIRNSCKNVLLQECDCRYVNNCIDCVRMDRARCAYDITGACFSFNETLFLENPEFYGPRAPIYDEDGIREFCIGNEGSGANTAAIVGGVLGGVAALAALAAIAAVIAYRMAAGGPPGPGAGAPGAGAAAGANVNPIYAAANAANNPLYSAA